MKKNSDPKAEERNDRSSNRGKGKSSGNRSNPKGNGGRSSKKDEREGNYRQDGKSNWSDSKQNPAWYYLDAKTADQVTQMSFQNLAGYPIEYDGKELDVPNIVNIFLNPCPGVIADNKFGTQEAQDSGINLAGYNWYTRLSATTGRVSSYAPQDVSTMILAFGSIIEDMEWMRRAFGVSKTMSDRNRDYPRMILELGMNIDSDDFFKYRSIYREQYNELVALLGGIKVPRNIAYFVKCAKLYERIFTDYDSPMAQTLVPTMYSTWQLDETTYSGGAILKTVPWQNRGTAPADTFDHYLTITKNAIMALLNSSMTTKIYTDMLNYSLKYNLEWWEFDQVFEDYSVAPVYDRLFLLQMHNATIAGAPVAEATYVNTATEHVTPYNDVYPDPNTNTLFYNPAIHSCDLTNTGKPHTGSTIIVDAFEPNMSLDDRCDITRYMSISDGKRYQPTGASTANAFINLCLPDHYVVTVDFKVNTTNFTSTQRMYGIGATLMPSTQWGAVSSLVSNIDWAPRFIGYDAVTKAYDGTYTGDVNFYTTIDRSYLEKIHKFVTFALYTVRADHIPW